MQRLILAAAILFAGVAAASADIDHYTNLLKQPRGDFELHADVDACAAQLGGRPQNGTPTSWAFKRCMAARGWRFDSTEKEHLYPDPDNPGLMCRDLKDAQGHVFGSSCSNF